MSDNYLKMFTDHVKDKINLLIEERLQELKDEEKIYEENLKRQIETLKAQSAISGE